jgi:hypothetical protein
VAKKGVVAARARWAPGGRRKVGERALLYLRWRKRNVLNYPREAKKREISCPSLPPPRFPLGCVCAVELFS